jgi:hypothetical protein
MATPNMNSTIAQQDAAALGRFAGIAVDDTSALTPTVGSTFGKILFNNTMSASNSVVPSATTNDLTIAEAGAYAVHCSLSLSQTGGGSRLYHVAIAVNGTAVADLEFERTTSGSGNRGSASVFGVLDLSATDVVTAVIKEDTGSVSTNIHNGQLVAYRIGA